jgi:hypothetical protein
MRRKANLCLALVGSAVLLAACGGGDDQPAAAGGGGSVNQAPTISGSPPASAMQDSQYAFTPAVSDPDGDTLTFTIVGKPDWATFNSATGALMGTPAPEDLGIYPNIVISVSDGQASSTLSAFSLEVVATSTGSATLSWTAPTENADGSPLTDLAGYKIYWGTSPGNYTESATINNPGITTFMVEQLTPRIWYFAATAFNSLDEESQYSNPVAKTVQ